ncbi:MAG: YMGG-like glycine zipper-containing protein [Natrialbaceae archaeon]|nr:YMGG-like glycine zipper-containing protein [Natrialbaceae archaeon]
MVKNRLTVILSRVRYAAIGAAIGGAIGAIFSRSAASSGAALGALAGATFGETRITAKRRIGEGQREGRIAYGKTAAVF